MLISMLIKTERNELFIITSRFWYSFPFHPFIVSCPNALAPFTTHLMNSTKSQSIGTWTSLLRKHCYWTLCSHVDFVRYYFCVRFHFHVCLHKLFGCWCAAALAQCIVYFVIRQLKWIKLNYAIELIGLINLSVCLSSVLLGEWNGIEGAIEWIIQNKSQCHERVEHYKFSYVAAIRIDSVAGPTY